MREKFTLKGFMKGFLPVMIIGILASPVVSACRRLSDENLENKVRQVKVQVDVPKKDLAGQVYAQPSREAQVQVEPQKNYSGRLVLKRTSQTDNSTMGELYLDGKFLCYTLEPPWKDNKNRESCIPTGDYDLSPRTSERFGKHYLVEGTGKRELILIHAGNFPRDTTGCIVVGNTQTKDCVGNSRKTINMLREKLGDRKYDFIVEEK